MHEQSQPQFNNGGKYMYLCLFLLFKVLLTISINWPAFLKGVYGEKLEFITVNIYVCLFILI